MFYNVKHFVNFFLKSDKLTKGQSDKAVRLGICEYVNL